MFFSAVITYLLLSLNVKAQIYAPTPSTCFEPTTVYGNTVSGSSISDMSNLRSSSFNPVSYARKIVVCGTNF